ncbi:uncharacterized protein LOC133177068 [Saccostrea echinata]|uniref:uncharacterized protein LOC133177068 n=1 Tax=Saccostrea echinata TaxID=191078 RepID=UPI002A7F63D7|nr:uncharacterized protein LOC133177068 [Saccostrea echinata]
MSETICARKKMLEKVISPTDFNTYSVCKFGVKQQKVSPIHFKQISRMIYQTKVLSQIDNSNTIKEESDFIGYTDLCLTLIDMCPSEITIWESIIKSIANFPQEMQKSLYKSISDKLAKFSEEEDSNMDYISFITELMYLESREFLERDLLQLVSDCSQLVLPSSFKDKIRSVPLIKSCARNTLLSCVSIEILNCLMLRAWESDALRKFVNAIYMCTRSKTCGSDMASFMSNFMNSRYGKVHGRMFFYEECVHALVKNLEGLSGELDDKRKGACIKAIVLEFQKLAKSGTAIQKQRMFLALVHHLDVYYKLMDLSFTCDKTLVTDCLHVLTVFNVQDFEEAKHLKEVFLPVLNCLRGLLQKISLGIRDIQCAVMDLLDIFSKTLFGQFLITFTLKSEGGLKLAPEILQMAIGSELPLQHLEAILTAHDNMNIRLNQWPNFKQNQYKALIRSLMVSCSLTEEPKHSELLSAATYIVQKS